MKKLMIILSLLGFLSCLSINPSLTTKDSESPTLNLNQAFSKDLRDVMAVQIDYNVTSSSSILALLTTTNWTRLNAPNLTYKLKLGDKLKFAIVPKGTDLIESSLKVIEIGTYTVRGGVDVIGFEGGNTSGKAAIKLKKDFTPYGVTAVALISRELAKHQFVKLGNNFTNLIKTKDDTTLNNAIEKLSDSELKSFAQKVYNEKKVTQTKDAAVAKAFDVNIFWVYNAPSNKNFQRKAKLKATTPHYKIWIDESTTVPNDFLEEYKKELETKIYPTLKRNLGEHKDINKDGKAEILISSNIDSTGRVGGYVYPSDYYEGGPHSNKRDILYMNTKDISSDRKSFYSTTAHELQHLHRIKYQYNVDPSKYNADRAWIDEGTAEYIADEAGYGPQSSRLLCYYVNVFCYINGKSLFDKNVSGALYAFRYMFMSYFYHSSSNDKAEREAFVYKSITGYTDEAQRNPTNTRANKLSGLLSNFKEYSLKYKRNPSILGSTNEEIFYKLYGSLLFQTSILSERFTDAEGVGVTSINKIAKKDSTESNLDFNNIISTYPAPKHLIQITSTETNKTTQLRFWGTKERSSFTPNSSRSGEFYFYKGNPKKSDKYIFFTSNLLIKNTSGTTTYNGPVTLQYNYSMINFEPDIKPSIISSFNTETNFLDTSYLSSYKEDTPVCIHERLAKQFEADIKRNPNLYKQIE